MDNKFLQTIISNKIYKYFLRKIRKRSLAENLQVFFKKN